MRVGGTPNGVKGKGPNLGVFQIAVPTYLFVFGRGSFGKRGKDPIYVTK